MLWIRKLQKLLNYVHGIYLARNFNEKRNGGCKNGSITILGRDIRDQFFVGIIFCNYTAEDTETKFFYRKKVKTDYAHES